MKTQTRRRSENRTNYHTRIKLLKSGRPRITFRKTNKYILAQYIKSKNAQDSVEINLTSRNLLEFGWPQELKGSLKSISASYLTGLLIGSKINKKEAPIVDIGMTRNIAKNKVHAFIKGLMDSGLDIQGKKESFPEEDRLTGKNMKKDFSSDFAKIKSKIIGKGEKSE